MTDEILRTGAEHIPIPYDLLADQAVSPVAVRVYGVISSLVGATDVASVRTTVCEVLGVSEGTWTRYVKELREAGWLSVERGGGGRPSSYYVHSMAGIGPSESDDSGGPERADVTGLPLAFSDASLQQEEEQEQSPPPEKTWDPEVVRLCELLADLYQANGNKRPNPNQEWWRESCRRLLTIDGPDGSGWSPKQVETIIRWALNDDFWQGNIRSMPKLRKQFDTLRARRNLDLTRRQREEQRHRAERTDADWMARTTPEVPE